MNDRNGMLPASISYGDSGYGCATPNQFSASAGWVDASSPCPAGMSIVYNRSGGVPYSLLYQIRDAFDGTGDIIEDWDYANRYGTAFNITLASPGVKEVAIGICAAQPELCIAAGGLFTIYVTWRHLPALIETIRRGLRDPAQVRSVPTSVAGTRNSNGDCEPPSPDQMGPAGLTYKWQQRSSAPSSNSMLRLIGTGQNGISI